LDGARTAVYIRYVPPRRLAQLRILRVFADDALKPIYGLDLIELAGLSSGTVYPVLARLERSGWIVGSWEELKAGEIQRPRRRLYRLTEIGRSRARGELDAYLRERKPAMSKRHWSTVPEAAF
jgi:PadR family transcriptional regulator PadR